LLLLYIAAVDGVHLVVVHMDVLLCNILVLFCSLGAGMAQWYSTGLWAG